MNPFDLKTTKPMPVMPAQGSEEKDPEVIVTEEIFNAYNNSARSEWVIEAQENHNFRNGQQWTPAQEKELKRQRMAPMVVNVIHPAVEQLKAALTTNNPRFSTTGREGSDMKVGSMFASILEYVWQQSTGRLHLKAAIDDYAVRGMGALLAYVDPQADNNRGEVLFKAISPLDLYVDPNSKDRLFRDAAHILVARVMTHEAIQRIYPRYASLLKSAVPIAEEDLNPAGNQTDADTFINRGGDQFHRKYRVIDRYSKVRVPRHHILDPDTGYEAVMEEDEFKKAVQNQIVVVESTAHSPVRFIVEPVRAGQAASLAVEFNGIFHYVVDPRDPVGQPFKVPGKEDPATDAQAGLRTIPGSTVVLKVVKLGDAINAGQVKHEVIDVQRVCRVLTIGDKKAYKGVLPIEDYPIVPIVNGHNRTPYPLSDVYLVKQMQVYVNKLRSLIVAHATNATNLKLLIPRGAMNREELIKEWGKAGTAVIEYDAELGAPVISGPVPLPNELYQNEAEARRDIQEIFGVYTLSQGDPSAAPQTYKGTIAIDEYGQRRIKAKQDDIEDALNQLASVLIQMIQAHYTEEKTFRIIRPNNTPYEVRVNWYDDDSDQAARINDITVGRFDVVVISGSTLPVNRWARFEYFVKLYELGLIDQIETLKQTEVIDLEGVMERFSEIQRLRSALAAAEEKIKELSGDLQTAQRESVHAQKRVVVEKFKADLAGEQSKMKSAAQVFTARLSDELNMAKREQAVAASKETNGT